MCDANKNERERAASEMNVHVWLRHNVTLKEKKKKMEIKHKKTLAIELAHTTRITREYPQHRGMGTQCVTVCQSALPYPHP